MRLYGFEITQQILYYDLTIQEFYTTIDGDFNDVMHRLMTEKLVTRFVLKFPGDPSMQQLRDAIAADDKEVAFRAIHTLKGVAANLSFTQLQHAASDLTEQLRPRTEAADTILYNKVEEVYQQTIDAISRIDA